MEYVFSREVDRLSIGGHGISTLEIEFGGLDYGFELDGILGMDFLLRAGTAIDLKELAIGFRNRPE